MKKIKFGFRQIILVVLILFLSVGCTVVSFAYQRVGPEFGYLGQECRPECKILKRKAGWPLPYVFDRMGVSVLRVLGVEDEWRLLPFVLDVLFYGVLWSIGGVWFEHRVGRADD